MKKRTLPLIALLLVAVLLSLTSCSLISGIGAGSSTADAIKISGNYEAINGSPRIKLSFSGSKVTVGVGSRSMSGTYTVVTASDNTSEIEFDFGEQTLPRCNIRTGSYPVSVGEQNGQEYMMIFGSRFNKVK